MVSLQFPANSEPPPGLDRHGEIIDDHFPKVKLRVNRKAVPEVLADVLAHHTIEDVSVEDTPLEEVIAEMFEAAEIKG